VSPIALPLAVTFAVQAAVTVALFCAPVLAPAAAPAFDVAPSAVGYYIAIAYVGSMLGSIAAGGWVARFGPIRVSQFGLAACLTGLALAAVAPALRARPLALALAAAGAFFVGLGYGPTTPASSVVLARATPRSLFSMVFSIKQTGVPAGGALAGALVPTLILLVGWRWSAVAIGIACVALAPAVEPVRRRYDVSLNPGAEISLARVLDPARLVLREPRLREMATASFCFSAMQISLVTFLVTFLVDAFGLSLVLAGFVMAISQIGSVLGRIGWGILADRAGTRRGVLGALGIAMGVLAMATLFAAPDWPRWALFAFAAAFGATAVGWNGVFLAQIAAVAPEGKTSEATGGCLFFTFLGVVVTPLAFNALLSATGSYALAYAAAGLGAIAMGINLLWRRGPSMG
jgi:MFS family permease